MVKVSRRNHMVILTEDTIGMRNPVGGIYTQKSTRYMTVETAKDYAKKCREALKRIPDATITMVEMMASGINNDEEFEIAVDKSNNMW